MTRPVASHPEAKPQTPCGQDCRDCAKADGCGALWPSLNRISAIADCQPAGGDTWK